MSSTTILSDNGASSGSAGLKQQAGNDGVLILQTTTSGGTATNALSIDTSQNISMPVAASKFTKLGAATSISLGTGDTYSGSTSTAVISGDSGTTSLNIRLYNVSYYYPFQFANTGAMSVGGATVTTSGAGITFPATQSASSDANTLDDYEEGTWTTTITQSDGNAPGVTYSIQASRYTKVGNLVHVQGYVLLSSKGTASGNVKINNLPFPNTTSTNAYASPVIGIFSNLTGIVTAYTLVGDFAPGASGFALYYTTGAGAQTALLWTGVTNTFAMEFSFTYQTAT